MATAAQIRRLLRDSYGLRAPRVRELGGFIDDVYRVETAHGRFVLKVNRNRKLRRDLLAQQLRFMEALRAHGIAAPALVRTKEGTTFSLLRERRPRPCMLVEFVAGEELRAEDARPAQLARFVAGLHRFAARTFPDALAYIDPALLGSEQTEEMERYVRRRRTIGLEALLAERRRILARYTRLRPRLSHALLVNDLAPANILVRRGDWVIVDFNIAGSSPRVDELAWMLTWYFVQLERMNGVRAFLRAYLRAMPLPHKDLTLLPELVVLYAALNWTPFEESRSPEDVVERLRRVRTLRTFLRAALREAVKPKSRGVSA